MWRWAKARLARQRFGNDGTATQAPSTTWAIPAMATATPTRLLNTLIKRTPAGPSKTAAAFKRSMLMSMLNTEAQPMMEVARSKLR